MTGRGTVAAHLLAQLPDLLALILHAEQSTTATEFSELRCGLRMLSDAELEAVGRAGLVLHHEAHHVYRCRHGCGGDPW